jgi:hypothetical protein
VPAQLRTGMIRLNGYLHQIGAVDPGKCACTPSVGNSQVLCLSMHKIGGTLNQKAITDRREKRQPLFLSPFCALSGVININQIHKAVCDHADSCLPSIMWRFAPLSNQLISVILSTETFSP